MAFIRTSLFRQQAPNTVPRAGGLEAGAGELVAGVNQLLQLNRNVAIQLCLIFRFLA
jgi:hypothetical protein